MNKQEIMSKILSDTIKMSLTTKCTNFIHGLDLLLDFFLKSEHLLNGFMNVR